MPVDLEAENRRLRALVDELEEAERQRTESIRFIDTLVPPQWRLTRQERTILIAMLNAKNFSASRPQLYAALRKDRFDINDVDVPICKMRQKLGDFGIFILTLRGIGYALKPESAAIVKAAIDNNANGAFGL